MDLKSYKIPRSIEIDNFFKLYTFNNWHLAEYFNYQRSIDPQIKFKTCKASFLNALDTIQVSVVPDEIKANIKFIKDRINNKRKKCNPTLVLNQVNYQDHATHSGDNFFENPKTSPKTKGKNRKKEVKVINAANMDKNMNTLISLVYKLYDDPSITILNLELLPEDSNIINKLYNSCVNNIKKFRCLTVIERSNLHVLLSSCINTVAVNYRTTIGNIIGVESLRDILLQENHSFVNHCDTRWLLMKKELMDSLKEKGVRGVRLFITRERLKIYEEELEERQSFQLKVFDLINYVLDEIEYGCLSSDSFELDFTVYWVKMFDFMLRKSGIKIKIGEPCCAATKLDREINEFEFKDTEQKNIMGRRVDVIFVGLLKDVGPIELASAEIKPANATEDMQRLDLNKNIRTSKSILNNLNMFVNGGNEALQNIGMMIVGTAAYLFLLEPYEGAYSCKKISQQNIFLPTDEEDFVDFINGDNCEQLISFVEHLSNLNSNVNVHYKKQKKRRISVETSGEVDPFIQPPSSVLPTFYSPKR